MSENASEQRDDVLFGLAERYAAGRVDRNEPDSAESPWFPPGDQESGPVSLETLILEHPDYASQLAEFAAAHFALIETPLDDWVRDAIEKYDLSFERRILATAFANPGRHWHNLYDYIDAFGFSLDTLASELGVGRDLMWRLVKHMIHVSTVPTRFIERLARLLGADMNTLRVMLGDEPPMLRDAWKESFADAIRSAHDMTPEQQRAWLEEAE